VLISLCISNANGSLRVVQASSLQRLDWQAGCLPHFSPSCITYAEVNSNICISNVRAARQGRTLCSPKEGRIRDSPLHDAPCGAASLSSGTLLMQCSVTGRLAFLPAPRGSQSGDASPHSILLPGSTLAHGETRPAPERGGLWSAVRCHRFQCQRSGKTGEGIHSQEQACMMCAKISPSGERWAEGPKDGDASPHSILLPGSTLAHGETRPAPERGGLWSAVRCHRFQCQRSGKTGEGIHSQEQACMMCAKISPSAERWGEGSKDGHCSSLSAPHPHPLPEGEGTRRRTASALSAPHPHPLPEGEGTRRRTRRRTASAPSRVKSSQVALSANWRKMAWRRPASPTSRMTRARSSPSTATKSA